MGWGAKKVAAPAPQPATRTVSRVDETEGRLVYEEIPVEPEVPKEKPSKNAKAQIEWHQLKAKKGWTEATLLLLLYEFIQNQALFVDLVAFAKRRK